MDCSPKLVVFSLDEQKYALDYSVVERVVRMVEITPMPGAPAPVLGVINVQGAVVPVFDLRRLAGMSVRELSINDHLIIVCLGMQRFAISADETEGVIDCAPGTIIPAEGLFSHEEYIAGVVKRADGMVLIYNLDKLLAIAGALPGVIGG